MTTQDAPLPGAAQAPPPTTDVGALTRAEVDAAARTRTQRGARQIALATLLARCADGPPPGQRGAATGAR